MKTPLILSYSSATHAAALLKTAATVFACYHTNLIISTVRLIIGRFKNNISAHFKSIKFLKRLRFFPQLNDSNIFFLGWNCSAIWFDKGEKFPYIPRLVVYNTVEYNNKKRRFYRTADYTKTEARTQKDGQDFTDGYEWHFIFFLLVYFIRQDISIYLSAY